MKAPYRTFSYLVKRLSREFFVPNNPPFTPDHWTAEPVSTAVMERNNSGRLSVGGGHRDRLPVGRRRSIQVLRRHASATSMATVAPVTVPRTFTVSFVIHRQPPTRRRPAPPGPP